MNKHKIINPEIINELGVYLEYGIPVNLEWLYRYIKLEKESIPISQLLQLQLQQLQLQQQGVMGIGSLGMPSFKAKALY